MSDEIESRISVLEHQLSELAEEDKQQREQMSENFLTTIKHVSDNYLEALKIQANSLSIPLLKDVLLPLMMKLFSFFSLLVLLLLGGVLGIKWMFGDLMKGIAQ